MDIKNILIKTIQEIRNSFIGCILIIISLILCLSIYNISYGQEHNFQTNSEIYLDIFNNTIDKNIKNYDWVYDSEQRNWQFVNNITKEYKIGYFYDKNGDIYYADIDGFLLLNKKDNFGQYFDTNGRLVNQNYLYSKQDFNNLAFKHEHNQYIKFKNYTEMISFLNRYFNDYQYNSQQYNFQYRYRADGTHILYPAIFLNGQYEREEIYKQILNTFQIPETKNSYEAIYNILDQLKNYYSYDINYILEPISNSIADHRGVCWHFVKITQLLLNKYGLNCEVLTGSATGQLNSEYHSWLRCKINNQWIYIDPTGYILNGPQYGIINYNDYIHSYKLKSNITLQ